MKGLRSLLVCLGLLAGTMPAAAEPPSIPDIAVQDQLGHTQNFYSDLVKDHIVAVNFIFTGCSAVCPRLGASSAALARGLAKEADSRYRVISISIDPANDTPEQLRDWSAHFGAAPAWTLVTGKPRDIDGLLRALQVYSADKDLHSGNFLLGNPATGTWRRVDGTTAPARLAEAMHDIAGTPKAVANADVMGE